MLSRLLAAAGKRLATSERGPCLTPSCARAIHSNGNPSQQSVTEPVVGEDFGVAIAIGGNMGDRYENIRKAIALLPQHGVQVARYARLYESTPAYVTEQPNFLNTAIAANTKLPPDQLLSALKAVEAALGRDESGQRNGPRPIDLDVVFYEDTHLVTSAMVDVDGRSRDRSLQLPHKRWHERSFVKAPLADLACDGHLPGGSGLRDMLDRAQDAWTAEGGEGNVGGDDLRAVIPLGLESLWPWQARPWTMGILNVTPDSFSDGGTFLELQVEAAVQHARQMVADGVDIIDVGGQSTRPHAARLPPEVELERVMPVIAALASDPAFSGVLITVDTFYAEVAAAAVSVGAHLINDVSGGTLDPDMHDVVAKLGVPYAMMHMRGDPTTMVRPEFTAYGDVATEVGIELQAQAEFALAAGIEPWRILLDPGMGFAKGAEGNLQLISGLPRMRRGLRGALRHAPLIVGASRKTFLGLATGQKEACDRDVASAAAAALAVAAGANIVRTHNVAFTRDAVAVAAAVRRASNPSHLLSVQDSANDVVSYAVGAQ